MTQPLVSVIIPAYNSGPYLAETLDSVLCQTYRCREVIIVDDGSTDDTPERVELYRSSVVYIRQGNSGAGAARNAGLQAASGDYIAFLDHDDLWLPEKLEIQLEVAAKHPESGLVVCDGVEFDGERILSPRLLRGPLAKQLMDSSDGEITGNFYIPFIQGFGISCPAQTLIPHRVVHRVGPLTTARNENSDFEYYLRIALKYPITFHRHSLVHRRYLASSRSGPLDLRRFEWSLMRVAVLKRHRHLCPPEYRPLVMSSLRTLVQWGARAAYYYGRQHDIAYARSYVTRLFRLVPRERSVIPYFLASWLPSALVDRLASYRRAVRRFWRVCSGDSDRSGGSSL